jgi:hypothetical protein
MARQAIREALATARKAANLIFSRAEKTTIQSQLYRSDDLKSVGEFVEPHLDHLMRGADMKGMFTGDFQTSDIARKVLKNASLRTKGETAKGMGFFEDKIFSQPRYLTKEKGSIVVRVSDIGDFPNFKRRYEAQRKQPIMMCVGGPAAEDQSVLASIIPEIRKQLGQILYLTKDYRESNVNHAAKQSHARHGNALNADSSLTGHSLLPIILMRNLIGVTPEEAVEPDFKKIDVPFTIDPAKLRIFFGNELNWLRQVYKRKVGEITEHDINRIESLLSQEIINVLEKETGVKISGGVDRSIQDSSSIHVAFTQRNAREVEHENKEFGRVGITAEKLTAEEREFFFGDAPIYSAWKYPGDTHIKFNTHESNQELAKSNGVQWLDGEEITRILLTHDEKGDAKVAGIVTKEDEFFPVDKLHFTGGYKVEYLFDKDSDARFQSSWMRNLVNRVEDLFELQQPLRNSITTSTGVSINAIFKKSDRIKRLIERYGSIGEIAVTNSHWTMIAEDDEHVVVRMTGGGNTGSEEYNPAYFLNVIANTRRIFGDDLIGILSTYGCPRAINARNSTEFARIAEGAILSYGKGGTGNTKRHAEAATGLMLLGFGDEVIDYFNQFQSRDGLPIGNELEKIHQHLLNVEFIHDNRERTNRRMGYDDSFSLEEAMAIAVLVAALSYALYKTLEKEEDKIEEEKQTTTISPKSATQLTQENKRVTTLN